MSLSKAQRQHRIVRLIEAHTVTSQAQLVELLAADEVIATQATVSRDLEDLGAVKVRVRGGEVAYAIPELPIALVAPQEHLRRVLGEWVVEVASSGNLVVLRTPPGSAHVVASALDRSGLVGVLGTVAGDDTLLVVVAEGRTGASMAGELVDLAGLGGSATSGPRSPAGPSAGQPAPFGAAEPVQPGAAQSGQTPDEGQG